MVSKILNKLNLYDEFKDLYSKIRNDFDFDYQKDCKARDYLSQILKKKTHKWKLEHILKSFKNQLVSKQFILIYGCGPSLEESVDRILSKIGNIFFSKFINLTADGSSILLRERNIKIDAIFTDLDGITKNEFKYSDFNVIHAHGDNLEKIKLFEEEILKYKNVIGTTQVEPLENVVNPGGFTDGDRIIYFIRNLIKPFQKIFLIGMDFKNIVGKYSKLDIESDQEGNLTKKKKLRYAVELLEWINTKIINEIYFVNSDIISDKFKYISIEDLLKSINY
ncbi:MAG: 6-hydroxymethylpterin diphosphokinase MptE-like protein [Promethearchaeota archaeon]